MLKTIKYLSLLGITTSIILITNQIFFNNPSTASAKDFEINRSEIVEFDIDETFFDGFSPREKQEQFLDWILHTIVSSSDLSVKEINQVLYDYPTVRYGYTESVRKFDYGATRSIYLGNGKIVAILPKKDAQNRKNQLTKIADLHRKKQEKLPKKLFVYEYEISSNDRYAIVTQRESIPGTLLYSKSFGYLESEIKNLEDLRTFIKDVDDISFASLNSGELVLGGRKIRDYSAKKLRIEDLAAIWQAEKQIAKQMKDFEDQWNIKDSLFNIKKSNTAFPEIIRGDDESEESWKKRLANTNETWQTQKEELKKEQDRIKELKKQDWETRKLVQGSGFSLDWTYYYPGVKQIVENHHDALVDLIKNKVVEHTEADLAKVYNGLDNRKEKNLLNLIKELSASQDPRAFLLATKLDRQIWNTQFQVARYDGNLQGTEVGMVLFYTDLLAKILGFNYLHTTEIAQISDFIPKTKLPISPIYEEQARQYSSTRMWFGPDFNGFSVTNDTKDLFFARKATQVFAASSNQYEPGVEVPANAYSATFINWWNNHYEEVASFESEYFRLNEIMKWGLILSWIKENDKEKSVDFLSEIAVSHQNWFPTWVRSQNHLQFTKWNDVICDNKDDCEVDFFSKGFPWADHEAMPLLSSTFKKELEELRPLVGGVTLPGRSSVQFSKSLPKARIDQWARNSASDIYHFQGNGTLHNIKNISFNRASVTSEARAGALGRGKFSEIKTLRFEKTIAKDGSRYGINTKIGKNDLGSLHINKSQNGFKVAWRSREVDLGQKFAKELSKADDIPNFIASNSNVELAINIGTPSRPQFLVRLKGTNNWMKIGPEAKVPSSPKINWDIRAAHVEGGRPISAKFLDNTAAMKELSTRQLSVEALQGSRQLSWNVAGNASKGSSKAVKIEITCGQSSLKGELTASGKMRFSGDQLKNLSQEQLTYFQRALDKVELANIQKLPATNGAIRHTISPEKLANIRLQHNLRNRSYRKVADDIVKDPKAFKRRIDQNLKKELDEVNLQLTQENYSLASRRLNELIEIHGPIPELTVRQGIANIGRGNLQQGIKNLQSTGRFPIKNRNRFFREINGRIQVEKNVTVRRNLHESAKFADWKHYQARKGLTDESISIYSDGNKVHLDLVLGKNIQRIPISAKNVKGINPQKQMIYVQDSPGLNNLDWSTSVNNSLQQVVSGKIGNVSKIPRGDIRHFKPSKIYSRNKVNQYKPINKVDNVLPPFYIHLDIELEKEKEEEEVGIILVSSTENQGNEL